MIGVDDLTKEERERYERGESVWRQDPPDPANPHRFTGSWIQKLSLGRSYEEWKKDNGIAEKKA